MSTPNIRIGFQKGQDEFLKDHHIFVKHLPSLYLTMQKVFTRSFTSRGSADLAIFDLGGQCIDHFNEILVLCANGFGLGGFKIVRGLYERTVTAKYLSLYPKEAEKFWNYFHVTAGKQLEHAKKIPGFINSLPTETVRNIEKEFKQQKELFQVPLCKRCNTTRTQMSWSELDIASMALKLNTGLDKLYLPYYFEPTMEAHPSAKSLIGGMKAGEDGRVVPDPDRQTKYIQNALIGAHCLILIVLDTQDSYFGLDLYTELELRRSEFENIWNGKN